MTELERNDIAGALALKLEGEKRGSFVQTLLASRHMRVLEI
jgi:hypothetical protein